MAEVFTNDPAREHFTLNVKLTIIDDGTPAANQTGPFLIAPGKTWKGSTKHGTSVVGLMSVTNRSNEFIRIKDVKNSSAAMTVQVSVLGVGKRYLLHIRSALDLPVGLHKQTVQLMTDSPTTPEITLELELEVTP